MIAALDNLIKDQSYRFVFIIFLALIIMFSKIGSNGLAAWDDYFYAEDGQK